MKLLLSQLEEQNALEKAVVQHHEHVFARSQGKESARGATLPIDQSAERAHVLETLLALGIPLSKLDDPRFQALIEKPHQALGGRRGVHDLQPVVHQRVQARLKALVAAKPVSIIFDGAKVNFLIEGLIARYLGENFEIQQVCIGSREIPRTLDADGLDQLIREQLSEAGILVKDVVAAISDSGQPNPACIGKWNSKAEALHFGASLQANKLLHARCLTHAFSNVGKTLKRAFPTVKLFMSGFKRMANESSAARQLWKDVK